LNAVIDQLPKSTVKQRTMAYLGLGPDDLATTTGRPGLLRLVLVTGVVLGVGIVFCALGHPGIGAPIISGALVVVVGTWYRSWETRKRP
jgi:hypothetical protein